MSYNNDSKIFLGAISCSLIVQYILHSESGRKNIHLLTAVRTGIESIRWSRFFNTFLLLVTYIITFCYKIF